MKDCCLGELPHPWAESLSTSRRSWLPQAQEARWRRSKLQRWGPALVSTSGLQLPQAVVESHFFEAADHGENMA